MSSLSSASISALPISHSASERLIADPNRASVTTWIAVLAVGLVYMLIVPLLGR